MGSVTAPIDGDVTVRGQSITLGDTDSTGVNVSGGITIGAAIVDTQVKPDVDTYIGGSAGVYTVEDVYIQSLHNYDVSGSNLTRKTDKQSSATTFSGSGGILSGSGADADAVATPNLESYVGSSATVHAANEFHILSLSYADMLSYAESFVFGLVGIGDANSRAESSGNIWSHIDGTVVAGDTTSDGFSNLAVAYHRSDATGVAFSISFGAAPVNADATVSPTVEAEVGAGGDVDAAGDAYTLAIAETSATPEAISKAIVSDDNSDGATVNPTLTVDIGAGAMLVSDGKNELQTILDQSILTDTIDPTTLGSNAITNVGNTAPNITSASAVNVPENTTAVITVQAEDDDGDTPTFEISGGADASFFSINSSTGVLTFDSAPDFETPLDDDADNVYEVVVKTADGVGGFDSQTILVTVTDTMSLMLLPGVQRTDAGVSDLGTVTQADVDALAAAALRRWVDTGLTDDQVEALEAIEYSVSDLSGGHIAAASGSSITIDPNANDYGWFVDATPTEDEEYVFNDILGYVSTGGDSAGGVDLLTVILHEQGHVLGLPDLAAEGNLMYQYINEGKRRLPVEDQALGVVPSSADVTHYVTTDDTGDADSERNRGANYIRQSGDDATVSGLISIIKVPALVDATVTINLGAGSVLESGSTEDVVITVELNNVARAVAGGFAGAVGIINADASITGTINVFLGGTINHGADLTLELHTKNFAVAIGEALAVGPGIPAGTGIDSDASVTPTINTFVSPSSNINVGGDFAIRTLSESEAIAESRGIAASTSVAVGVSLADAVVAPTVNTFIGNGATINAGGAITVETLHNVDRMGNSLGRKAKATAEASAGSLLGSGSGADANADASANVNAYVDSGAILNAGPSSPITIRAISDNTSDADAFGLAIGGFAGVGAALADATSNGSTKAYLEGNVTQGGSLTIEAISTHDADADTTAAAGGLLASGAGSDADATASPTLEAFIGDNRTVNVNGAVDIGVTGNLRADANANGISAGSLAVGASLADAVVNGQLDAYVGIGADITAGSLTIDAAHEIPAAGNTAEATAGGSAGALVGVVATATDAEDNTDVLAYVKDNATLDIDGDTAIRAVNTTKQVSDASSIVGGIVAVGATDADASASTTTKAYLGAGVDLTGRSLSVKATGDDDNYAETTAGAGGVVGVAAASPSTTNTSTVVAEVRADAVVNLLEDADGDRIADSADADHDNDGIPDPADVDLVGGPDADSDNITDAADADRANLDSDSDGVPNAADADIVGGPDADGDGIIDPADPDADNDGIPDGADVDIVGTDDTDGDGIIDAADADADNDGIPDAADVDTVGGTDTDSDGIIDDADIDVQTSATDTDGDGVIDDFETDDDDDGVINGFETDRDGDGIVDNFDPNVDGDGIIDSFDPDLDNDGILDTADSDFVGGADSDGDEVIDAFDLDSAVNDDLGNLVIQAAHTARFNEKVINDAGGLLSGSGATIRNTIDSTVEAAIRARVDADARDVEMTATNTLDKPDIGINADGDTGGLISGAGVDSLTTIDFTTEVIIGNNADVEVVGIASNDEVFDLHALNVINAHDEIKLVTGGALAGASAETEIRTDTDVAKVSIGNNAKVTSSGRIDASARGNADVGAVSATDTFGAGTVSTGEAVVELYPENTVVFGTGADVFAAGDLNVSAGVDTEFNRDSYSMTARYDGFAGSLIPIEDVDALGILVIENLIDVKSGAVLETARKARLHTERLGGAVTNIKAKVVSWASEAKDFLLEATGGTEEHGGTGHAEAHGTVEVDGTVKTGTYRNQSLILEDWNEDTGEITMFSASDGVTFTTTIKELQSELFAELEFAEEQLAEFGSTNATLKQFYEDEIERIEGELDALGLMETETDPNAGGDKSPVSQSVMTVIVNPMYAEAGSIDIRSDQTQGSGTFDAPRDASINVENRTPAFLEILELTIPDINGGVFMNGSEVFDNAEFNDKNVAGAAEDNAFNLGEGNVPVGTASFTITSGSSATTPTIVVDNTLASVTDRGDYVWPDITILSDEDGGNGIRNIRGDVTLRTFPTGRGNINIFNTVLADNLLVEAAGNLVIDGNTGFTKFHVEGDPLSIWGPATTGDYTGEGDFAPGVAPASVIQQAATLAIPAKTPHSVFGNRVTITVEYLNINGILKSGKSEYFLTLNSATETEIADLLKAGAEGERLFLEKSSNSEFAVFYNQQTGKIEIDEVFVGGGFIDITGRVMNTGKGEIQVLGGYGDINVTNQTKFDVVIKRLDASNRGEGTLIIKDKARGTVDNPLVTTYTKDETGVTRVVDDGIGGDPTETTTGLTDTNSYATERGWRYAWQVKVSEREIRKEERFTSSWLGIIDLGEDFDEWDEIEILGEPVVLEDEGVYFFKDTALKDTLYTYNETVIEGEAGPIEHTHDNHTHKSWYGKKTKHNKFQQIVPQDRIHTHTVRADYPILVKFIGLDEASINLNSTGSGKVLLEGPILNPSGTTSITSNRNIRSLGAAGIVGGRKVTLDARTGLGTTLQPLLVDVDSGGFGGLDASTNRGNINITQVVGDLPIEEVIEEAGGTVTLTAEGGLTVAQSGASTWHEGLVQAGTVNLDAVTGGIGNSSARPLVLDSSNAGTSPTSLLKDEVVVSAVGDVFISEKDGDLRLNKLQTAGDVWLEVQNGDLLDVNQDSDRDDRTYLELKNGLWQDLQLTSEGGAEAKIQETLDSFAATKEQEYNAYWQFRSTQPDPSVYDNTHTVTLTAAEEDFYRTELGFDDAAIDTLESARTTQYHTLHATWGPEGDVFDPDFTYDPTTDEENALRASVKVWTEEELLFTVSVGLIFPVADTEVEIEDPNIVGQNITLILDEDESSSTGGGAGRTGGRVEIAIDPSTTISLTDDERVALAAAERNDVVYLSAAPAAITADISGSTITRTAGDSLSSISDGDLIQLLGNSDNETEGQQTYEVDTVSGNVITLLGTTLITENAVDIEIAPVVTDTVNDQLDIRVIQISQREDIDVTATGVLNVTADDQVFLGSEVTLQVDQVTAGDSSTGANVRLKTSQSILNAATLGDTNVRAADLVLEASGGPIGTAAKPFHIDLVGTGILTARADGDIYITEHNPSGTAGDLRVGTIFSQTGIVVLAADGAIVDALNHAFPNIQADDLILNAAGGIGEPGDHLDIDLAADGLLTATAVGDIFIAETFLNMNIRNVLSTTGDVDLQAHLFILDAVDLVNPSDPTSGDDNAGPASNPRADVIGNDITLTALGGGIGLASNNLDIDSAYSGPGVLTSSSNLANTYLIEVASDGTPIQNLSLFQVGTSPDETAFITVPTGAIFNRNGSTPNVVSGKVWLFANDDIGESDIPIETAVGNLEGISTTGSIYIENTGGLDVGGVADAVGESPEQEVTAGGITAGDSVFVGASSPVTLTEPITSDKQIVVIARDDADDDDIPEPDRDDLTVEPGIALTTTVGGTALPELDTAVIYYIEVDSINSDLVRLLDAPDGSVINLNAAPRQHDRPLHHPRRAPEQRHQRPAPRRLRKPRVHRPRHRPRQQHHRPRPRPRVYRQHPRLLHRLRHDRLARRRRPAPRNGRDAQRRFLVLHARRLRRRRYRPWLDHPRRRNDHGRRVGRRRRQPATS